MTEMRFDGRVALVTGAGRGLGRHYALLLAHRGAMVVVNDVGSGPDGAEGSEDAAAAVVAEIVAAGGTAVADRRSVLDGAAIVQAAVDAFGRLDIVVNNAGISGGGPFAEIPREAWDRMIDTHLGGTVAVTRAAWPYLARSGAGRVVSMSSSASFGAAFTSHYSTAKSAMIGFTRSLADEGRPAGITVNAVMPSAYTRLTAQIPVEPLRRYLADHFDPARVAPFVAWLAHETTSVTGQMFAVGAGRAGRVMLVEGEGSKVAEDTPEAWAAVADATMSMSDAEMPASMTEELYWKMGLVSPEGAALAANLSEHAGGSSQAF